MKEKLDMNKTYLITVFCGGYQYGNVVQEVTLPFNLSNELGKACKALNYRYEDSVILNMTDVTYEDK